MRGDLLTKIQSMELSIAEAEKAFHEKFPKIDPALYNSRSFPGGAFQTMHQDIQRLRQRVREYFPTEQDHE